VSEKLGVMLALLERESAPVGVGDWDATEVIEKLEELQPEPLFEEDELAVTEGDLEEDRETVTEGESLEVLEIDAASEVLGDSLLVIVGDT
jgi:hypothetical protein